MSDIANTLIWTDNESGGSNQSGWVDNPNDPDGGRLRADGKGNLLDPTTGEIVGEDTRPEAPKFSLPDPDVDPITIGGPGGPIEPTNPIEITEPIPGGIGPIDLNPIDPIDLDPGFGGGFLEPVEVDSGIPEWKPDPSMTIEEQLMDMAEHVLENTEGLDDKYRDASREFLIEMNDLQGKLEAAEGNPALQQAIREEMVQAADEYAGRMQEPVEHAYSGYDPDHPYNDIMIYRPEVVDPGMQAIGNAAADLTGALATKYGVDLPEPEPVIGINYPRWAEPYSIRLDEPRNLIEDLNPESSVNFVNDIKELERGTLSTQINQGWQEQYENFKTGEGREFTEAGQNPGQTTELEVNDLVIDQPSVLTPGG